jgi:hypothetical protein
MLLAGSVTFPATFPQVGRLMLHSEPRPGRPAEQLEILSVEEFPSPRVTLSRRMLASSVRALFLPRDPAAVDFSDGVWLLEDEIVGGLRQRLAGCEGPVYGIAFVPESEPSMLHVSAGMTAAESSQYYPPLPGDPSHNHYNPWPINGPLASHVQRACSAADDATIYMHACSSLDPWWEMQRARAMPVRSSDLQEITAAIGSESLMTSCTVSHVGLPTRTFLQPQAQAAACAAAQPFPTDDLQP